MGEIWQKYGRNLDENLNELVEQLKDKSYRLMLAKRVVIPKDNGKTRPLNIYCYEDKLVQDAFRRILEAIFEPMFYDEINDLRSGKGCHTALRQLNGTLE